MANQIEITATKMNQIAEMIGTTDKNIVIGVMINSLVNEGGYTVEMAIDAVCGEGYYKILSEEVFRGLKAAA